MTQRRENSSYNGKSLLGNGRWRFQTLAYNEWEDGGQSLPLFCTKVYEQQAFVKIPQVTGSFAPEHEAGVVRFKGGQLCKSDTLIDNWLGFDILCKGVPV